MSDPLVLDAQNIHKTFKSSRGIFKATDETHALDDVSIQLAKGEILGLVGESGCGKSTFAKVMVGLERADAGSLTIAGRPIFADGEPGLMAAQRGVQMVFQDPYGSLNPRMRARAILAEGLRIRGGLSKSDIMQRAMEHLALVGLDPDSAAKYPHQFSGGQRQRLCIARAIITKPQLLLADEAASALDVSVQMQILNLLLELRDKIGLSMIFISHDMGVIEYLCDRIAVMYRGRIVESGAATDVLDHPRHPYTHRLIAARPRVGVRKATRIADVEAFEDSGGAVGCAYAGRCPRAMAECREQRPELQPSRDHVHACFHPM